MINFIKHHLIYIVTIIISLILTVPFCIWGGDFYNVLSSVGCSGIAASLMAIFIDIRTEKQKQEKLERAKETYFRKLYDELLMILQRVLWFDNRFDEKDFDWSLPLEYYSTMDYMVYSSKYPVEEISYEEAKKRLKTCAEKYTIEKVKSYTQEEQSKVIKMFQIISTSGNYLKAQTDKIKQNEIMLSTENYLSLENINSLEFNVNLALTIMGKKNKNYSAAIEMLVSSIQIIREHCNYVDKFTIALQGSVPMKNI